MRFNPATESKARNIDDIATQCRRAIPKQPDVALIDGIVQGCTYGLWSAAAEARRLKHGDLDKHEIRCLMRDIQEVRDALEALM